MLGQRFSNHGHQTYFAFRIINIHMYKNGFCHWYKVFLNNLESPEKDIETQGFVKVNFQQIRSITIDFDLNDREKQN